MNIKKDLKIALTGGFVILFYLATPYITGLFTVLFGINIYSIPIIFAYMYLMFFDLVFLSIIIYVYKKEIILNLKEFISNIKSYFLKYFKYWILALLLMIVSNILITTFTQNGISQNQENVNELFIMLPLYASFLTVIYAPLMEELVFRLSIRKIFPYTNILYIIMSGFIFGIMHVLSSINNLSELLYLIPYSIPGMIFAYTYTKSKNIFVPIMLHFIHNTLTLLIQIIL